MKLNCLSRSLKTSLMYGVAFSGLSVSSAVAQDAGQDQADDNTDVIYVTSRKRPELLVEVPMNIAVVGAEEIAHRNLIDKEDAYRTFAGAANPRGQLILRGLSGGNDSTPDTTSTWTDGVEFDFGNLYDVERIEVLRGPQGTLWGSNAIGGTVQVITNKPNLNEYQASGSVLFSSEQNRDGIGTRASAMVNVPIVEDKIGLRITGSSGRETGKVYNAYTNTAGSHNDHYIRTQLMWEPGEESRLNFSWINFHDNDSTRDWSDLSVPGYYYEAILSANPNAPYGYDVTGFDFPSCNPADASRVECYNDRFGTQLNGHNPKFADWELMDPYTNDKTNLFALTFDQENIIEGVDLSYVGSYRDLQNRGRQSAWTRYDANDMFRTWIIDEGDSQRWTHELRLQSNDYESPFQWTVGTFYDKYWLDPTTDGQWQYHASDNRSRAIAAYLWGDYWGLADPTALGQTLYGDPTKNYNYTVHKWVQEEFAAFGEASYTAEISNGGRIEFTGGLRYYNLKDDLHDETSGIWVDPSDLGTIDTVTKDGENGTRKKFSVNYMPSDEFSIFALYSEGYRRGGNNGPTPPQDCTSPDIDNYTDRYGSDQIKNYEIGFKGFAFDRRVSFSAAVYQIDWTGVQVSVYMPSCGFSYSANAGEARSKGIEFESTTNLSDTTKLVMNASYTKSTILSNVESIEATAGDDMTMVPKYNYYIALDQGFTIGENEGYVRIDASGYGKTKSHFRALETDISPAYTVFNAALGFNLSETATVALHVKNLFNQEIIEYKRQRYGSDWSLGPRHYYYGRERTFELRLDMEY
jgi:iron complex outermembrane receptor protein